MGYFFRSFVAMGCFFFRETDINIDIWFFIFFIVLQLYNGGEEVGF